jgi:hypothetical protein
MYKYGCFWLKTNSQSVGFTGYQSLKCLSSRGESNTALMTLCPEGTGPLTVWTDTLFTPAFEKGPEFLSIFIYLTIKLAFYNDVFLKEATTRKLNKYTLLQLVLAQ